MPPPPPPVSQLRRCVRLAQGVFFCAVLFVTSLLGSVFILVPLLPCVACTPAFWRRAADRLIGFWLTLPVALIHYMYGTRVRVSGDAIDAGRPAIIVMNHRTRLDWMFFWNALYNVDPFLLTTEKISLKWQLKRVPGAGWAMECDGFIFLRRNWEHDKEILTQAVHYYIKYGRPYQILLFPEGTDMCEHAAGRSRKFAAERGLQQYDYALHPRTAGFEHLVKLMRQCDYLHTVYDVTVGYDGAPVQSELALFARGPPDEVHFHVRAYDARPGGQLDFADDGDETAAAASPADNYGKSALARWLIELWRDKEERLRRFYAMEEGSRRFELDNDTQVRWPTSHAGAQRRALLFTVAFWAATTSAWLYFALYLGSMRWFFVASVLVFVAIDWRYGGVERLCCRLAQR